MHIKPMQLFKIITVSACLTTTSVLGINRSTIATPYYGPGIGTCQEAKKKQLFSARCFDSNDHYARYENVRDWEKGQKSTSPWPGM